MRVSVRAMRVRVRVSRSRSSGFNRFSVADIADGLGVVLAVTGGIIVVMMTMTSQKERNERV
jgi:hypothetical protein